jgi:hypothetical protein
MSEIDVDVHEPACCDDARAAYANNALCWREPCPGGLFHETLVGQALGETERRMLRERHEGLHPFVQARERAAYSSPPRAGGYEMVVVDGDMDVRGFQFGDVRFCPFCGTPLASPAEAPR